jgi:DNA-binding transcriptional LysR family regulator
MLDLDKAALDLNLLLVLDAVIETGSVSRAAQRLHLSQSATSSALGRLRAALGDPLLVRTAGGMVPTPRALALAGPVHRALSEIRQALAGGGHFEPGTARRLFTVQATDFVQGIVLPPLLAEIAAKAPHIRLRLCAPTGGLPTAKLASGELDLVLARRTEAPAGLYEQKLWTEGFLSAVRSGHPCAGQKLTLERFLELRHVTISFASGMAGPVDEALDACGLRRDIALAVPYFHIALAAVAASDLVVTVPEWLARAYAPQFSLSLIEPPLELTPHSTYQYWHERTHAAADHRWLRAAVQRACRQQRQAESRQPHTI